MKRLTAIADCIQTGAEWLTSALLLATSLVIGWQVFAGKVLQSRPSWSEEIGRFGMMWFGLIGAAIALRRGSHIAVVFLADRLPKVLRTGVAWFVCAAQLGFAGFFVYFGVLIVRQFMHETSAGAHIPVGLVYIAVPLTGLLMALFVLLPGAQAGSVGASREADA